MLETKNEIGSKCRTTLNFNNCSIVLCWTLKSILTLGVTDVGLKHLKILKCLNEQVIFKANHRVSLLFILVIYCH